MSSKVSGDSTEKGAVAGCIWRCSSQTAEGYMCVIKPPRAKLERPAQGLDDSKMHGSGGSQETHLLLLSA